MNEYDWVPKGIFLCGAVVDISRMVLQTFRAEWNWIILPNIFIMQIKKADPGRIISS